MKFLKILYNAMKRFWGSLYVTSNVFFNEMFFIQTRINKFITNQVYLLASMARNMKGKFDKYWGNGDEINFLLYVVLVLDPRRKLSYLQFCFSTSYDDVVVNEMIALKDVWTHLFEHFTSIDSPIVPIQSEGEVRHQGWQLMKMMMIYKLSTQELFGRETIYQV